MNHLLHLVGLFISTYYRLCTVKLTSSLKALYLAHVTVNLAHNVIITSTLQPINQIMKKKIPKEGRVLIATSCLLSGYDHVSYKHSIVERWLHIVWGSGYSAILRLCFGHRCGSLERFLVVSLKSLWTRMLKKSMGQSTELSFYFHRQLITSLHSVFNHGALPAWLN